MSLLRATARHGVLLCLIASPTLAAEPDLSAAAVNGAVFDGTAPDTAERSALAIKTQVLLDRLHFSPGVIDGYWGENVAKAIAAYEEANGLQADGQLDSEVWAKLTAAGDADIITIYTLSDADLKEPYVDEIPEDYAAMAQLERLSFTGPAEMLAERFHMDRKLFDLLNPDAAFDQPGVPLTVTGTGDAKPQGKAATIVISRSSGSLRALDAEEKLLAFYPVSVGSDSVPSPTGTHTIKNVVPMPNYAYRPEVNFQQGQLTENLMIPPGPNGPVGSVWIGLDKPTYGIHGTAEPSPIGKHFSHGCARLTNWDAEELATLVAPGITVTFVD
ncbi:L,D-transpeptidase [Iodidimonas sp. SYSU 1G8]|uniref:L,D-transpeptidase family protein n=1 Tax=Iodidimonas sp. SYSU 1G8 TaxID=3133967 RepID=UPI0031FEC437